MLMKARDLQNIPTSSRRPDSRKLAIDKVGVKAIRHPMRIQERSGGVQHTVATFNMYVGLPHHFKGTHMSRFVEILEANEREITVETFQQNGARNGREARGRGRLGRDELPVLHREEGAGVGRESLMVTRSASPARSARRSSSASR